MATSTITTSYAPGSSGARSRHWSTAAGLTGAAGGAVIAAGAFLPWIETFAGLIQIPGVRGGNGRILAAAGFLLAAAGLYHAVRGGSWSRWLIGLTGFAALGFSGYLLIQLAATVRVLGGDSMVLARGGPGLWVTAAGSLLAAGTLFLPSPAPVSPRSTVPGRAGLAGAPGWLGGGRAVRLVRAVRARAGDLESAGARRGLQIALGLVWLADAALQLQPLMFGRAFVANVLMPASMGNPALVTGPQRWVTHLIMANVAAWNTAFALAQLAIAVGLLWRPVVKAALAASVGWALAVWWFGEGLGGVLTGSASPVTGAPGAVILYALLAVLAWPARSGGRAGDSTRPGGPAAASLAADSPLGSRWGTAAWLVLWGSFSYLVLQPAVRAPGSLRASLARNAAGEPGWLAALDRAAATAAGAHGTLIAAVLAAVFLVIAAGVLHPATIRPALALAALTGLAIWVVGENFGQILTGAATDPNSGLLLVLLAAAYWPASRRHDRCGPASTPGNPRSLTAAGLAPGPKTG
jgi:hypothetical protein